MDDDREITQEELDQFNALWGMFLSLRVMERQGGRKLTKLGEVIERHFRDVRFDIPKLSMASCSCEHNSDPRSGRGTATNFHTYPGLVTVCPYCDAML